MTAAWERLSGFCEDKLVMVCANVGWDWDEGIQLFILHLFDEDQLRLVAFGESVCVSEFSLKLWWATFPFLKKCSLFPAILIFRWSNSPPNSTGTVIESVDRKKRDLLQDTDPKGVGSKSAGWVGAVHYWSTRPTVYQIRRTGNWLLSGMTSMPLTS